MGLKSGGPNMCTAIVALTVQSSDRSLINMDRKDQHLLFPVVFHGRPYGTTHLCRHLLMWILQIFHWERGTADTEIILLRKGLLLGLRKVAISPWGFHKVSYIIKVKEGQREYVTCPKAGKSSRSWSGGDVQATVVKPLGSGAGKGNIKLLELWARHFFKKIK